VENGHHAKFGTIVPKNSFFRFDMTKQMWRWYDRQGQQQTKDYIIMTRSNGIEKWEWHVDGELFRELHIYSNLEKDLQKAFKRCIGGTLPTVAASDDASRPEPGVLLLRARSLNTFEVYWYDDEEDVVSESGQIRLDKMPIKRTSAAEKHPVPVKPNKRMKMI
jgi:hypothetical protein